MDYKYRILHINSKERWIHIDSKDEWDRYEPDAFVHFVKKIRNETEGTIENVGDCRYIINYEGPQFIYQWDDLFGIVVIYPENITEDDAVGFLSKYLSRI